MPLVYILAQAPWGPIQLRTAESHGEMLHRLVEQGGQPPAHVEDVGDRDPVKVMQGALRMMQPPMDATGLIPERVANAARIVAEAVSRVPARVVAYTPSSGISGQPESHDAASVSEGEAWNDDFASKCVGARGVDGTPAMSRRQPRQDIDVRAIRTGLKLSQPEFAQAFGLKLGVLRDWEQGRTAPDRTARTLLMVIEARPDAVREALTAST